MLYAYLDPRIARSRCLLDARFQRAHESERADARGPKSMSAPSMTDAASPCKARPTSAPLPRSGARTPCGAASCAIPPRPPPLSSCSLSCAAAILAPLIAPLDPLRQQHARLRFCKPLGDRCLDVPAGADNQGRDMLSRILFGLRATLGMRRDRGRRRRRPRRPDRPQRRLLQAPRHAADAPGRRAALLPLDPVRPRHRRRAGHRPVLAGDRAQRRRRAVDRPHRPRCGAIDHAAGIHGGRPRRRPGRCRPDLALPSRATAGRPS